MLPWQPLRIEVVIRYTFDILSEAIFYPLRTFFEGCQMLLFVWFPKFNAHTHHYCQEILTNKYYMGLLLVAMATIEVDSV